MMSTRKRRRDRADVSRFKAALASPEESPFVLPAGAAFAFKVLAGSTNGDTIATIVGPSARTIKAPTLSAGAFTRRFRFERATEVTLEADVELWLDTGLARLRKVAEE